MPPITSTPAGLAPVVSQASQSPTRSTPPPVPSRLPGVQIALDELYGAGPSVLTPLVKVDREIAGMGAQFQFSLPRPEARQSENERLHLIAGLLQTKVRTVVDASVDGGPRGWSGSGASSLFAPLNRVLPGAGGVHLTVKPDANGTSELRAAGDGLLRTESVSIHRLTPASTGPALHDQVRKLHEQIKATGGTVAWTRAGADTSAPLLMAALAQRGLAQQLSAQGSGLSVRRLVDAGAAMYQSALVGDQARSPKSPTGLEPAAGLDTLIEDHAKALMKEFGDALPALGRRTPPPVTPRPAAQLGHTTRGASPVVHDDATELVYTTVGPVNPDAKRSGSPVARSRLPSPTPSTNESVIYAAIDAGKTGELKAALTEHRPPLPERQPLAASEGSSAAAQGQKIASAFAQPVVDAFAQSYPLMGRLRGASGHGAPQAIEKAFSHVTEATVAPLVQHLTGRPLNDAAGVGKVNVQGLHQSALQLLRPIVSEMRAAMSPAAAAAFERHVQSNKAALPELLAQTSQQKRTILDQLAHTQRPDRPALAAQLRLQVVREAMAEALALAVPRAEPPRS